MTRPRDIILRRLREGRTNPELAGDREPPAPQPAPPPFDPRTLVDRWRSELEALTGHVYGPFAPEAVATQLIALAQQYGAAEVMAWDEGELLVPRLQAALAVAGVRMVAPGPDGGIADREHLGRVALGLCGTVAGLADTGSIIIASGPGRARAASLVPPAFVALLRVTDLFPDLPTWMRLAAPDHLARAANVVILTGPSRTADIEKQLVIGVHGPGEVHVILVDERLSGQPASDEPTPAVVAAESGLPTAVEGAQPTSEEPGQGEHAPLARMEASVEETEALTTEVVPEQSAGDDGAAVTPRETSQDAFGEPGEAPVAGEGGPNEGGDGAIEVPDSATGAAPIEEGAAPPVEVTEVVPQGDEAPAPGPLETSQAAFRETSEVAVEDAALLAGVTEVPTVEEDGAGGVDVAERPAEAETEDVGLQVAPEGLAPLESGEAPAGETPAAGTEGSDVLAAAAEVSAAALSDEADPRLVEETATHTGGADDVTSLLAATVGPAPTEEGEAPPVAITEVVPQGDEAPAPGPLETSEAAFGETGEVAAEEADLLNGVTEAPAESQASLAERALGGADDAASAQSAAAEAGAQADDAPWAFFTGSEAPPADATLPRHTAAGLSDEQVWTIYRAMRLARLLDDRMWLLNRQGIGHFAVPSNGHEACAAGFAAALRPAHDWLVPHYRDLAALLMVGMTPTEVMHNYLATAADAAGAGRQNYAHWGHYRLRIKTVSSPQGPHVPHGVGLAHASKIRGLDEVAWIGFGDGTSSKGDVHEAMNYAAVHRLPCIFCCENNGLAISVRQERQMAVTDVALRAGGYGMPGVVVDGTDPIAMYVAAATAVARARAGEGPTFIEAKTMRLLPHTSNDDDRHYRSLDELQADRSRDPLDRFRAYLISVGLNDEERESELQNELMSLIAEAQAEAQATPAAPAEETPRHVWADPSILDDEGFYR